MPWLKKQGKQFWKCWASKFEHNNKSTRPSLVNCIVDSKKIAEQFACYFAKTCTNSSAAGAQLRKPRRDMVWQFNNSSGRINNSSGRISNSSGRISSPEGTWCDNLIIRPDELIIRPDELVIRPDELLNCHTMSLRGFRTQRLRGHYERLRRVYCGNSTREDHMFDAELVENVISKLKCGKAAGLDGISAEHLIYRIVMLFCPAF